MKNKLVSKQTCSDCVHHWACAAWNIGSIASMDATNCTNFEKFDVSTIPDLVKCGKCVHYADLEGGLCTHPKLCNSEYTPFTPKDRSCSYGERKDGGER